MSAPRRLRDLGASDVGQVFEVTLTGGTGRVFTWEYLGDGGERGHRFRAECGEWHSLLHPDWELRPRATLPPHAEGEQP